MHDLDPRQVFDPELRVLREVRSQQRRLDGIERHGAPSSITPTPSTHHAASHEEGGSDPLTPASIGAADEVHASRHHTGGADPLAPGDIGAAAATHSSRHHTGGADALSPSDIGAAAATHSSAHHTGGADALAPSDIGAAAATHASRHHTGGADALAPGDIGAEVAADRGAANGYADLDADARLPLAELPLALQLREITHFKRSTPGSGECLMDVIVGTDCDFLLPAGLTGSFFKASVAATASTVFTLKKNGTAVATCTFAAAGTVATFTAAADILLTAGDRLQLFAPAPDSTLADLAWNLLGTRLNPGDGYEAGPATWMDEVMADSPAGYWRLGESSGNAADSSGNGRTATVNGSPTRAVTGLQTSDTDKACTMVANGNFTVPSFSVGTSYTLECLVKMSPYATAPRQMIDRDEGGALAGSARIWGLTVESSVHASAGKVRPAIFWSDGSFTEVHSTSRVDDDQVHHVALTVDCASGTTTVKLYVDGVEEFSGTYSKTPNTGSRDIGIGRAGGGDTYSAKGTMDEVAIYDHALSGARIAAHYAAL